ncbi:hypothetical protein [Micromonospora sp. NBC_01796]|uniref:hypothetical protein n=1 Tax=Micromonospora sp. NBC_01796 TaxID=2975987 RepID=UPI002DD7F655|nr:hypothetical protein [Micromonospora sp. NBC_01796]WSA89627.1 hypothetical protein OIE47_19545 [Micromonospora sp. NBC_01796]
MRQHDQQNQDDQQTARTPVQVDDRDWPDDPDRTDDADRMNGRDRTDDPERVDDLDRTDDPDRTDDRDPLDDPDRDRLDDDLARDRLDDDLDRVDGRDRADDPDRTEYHEPAPLPTTFGAPTVGGAVAASALASGNRTDEFDARVDETVGPDNGQTDGEAFDVQTPEPGTAATTPSTAAPSATVDGDGSGPLLDQETTAGLRDRWRDVQLRFVDDPQAALGEARELVGEAVESLTSALAAQRDKLDGGHDGGAGADDAGETERIRLSIRRYRDFLDRVLDR